MKIAGKWLAPTEGIMLSGISAWKWDCNWMTRWRIPEKRVPKVKAVICESLRRKDSELIFKKRRCLFEKCFL